MLQHAGAFVYVNLVTFGLCAASVWLVGRGLTDGFAWAAAAVLMVPTAILLYARHWGRFAWLSLNFLPRQAKRPRVPAAYAEKPWRDFTPEEAPARRAPIASLPGDGIRAGEPAAASSSSGIRAKTPERQAPPAEKLDEWSDTAPYEVLDDPALPSFPKAPAAPPTPTAAPAAPIVIEEEDEWASNKKPYAVSEEGAPVAPAPADVTTEKSPADTPVSFTQYYEERARQEAEEERRAQEAKRTMPARSKKTPTFQTAFFAGVWNFMFYPNTLVAWANLAVFTLVEFLLLYMLVMFRPRLP
jgi:hypothetical protein